MADVAATRTAATPAEPSLHRVLGPWLLLLFIVGDMLERCDVGVGLAGPNDLGEAPVEHRIFLLRLLVHDAPVDGELCAAV